MAALAGKRLGGAVRAFIDDFQKWYGYCGEEAIIARRETDAWARLF